MTKGRFCAIRRAIFHQSNQTTCESGAARRHVVSNNNSNNSGSNEKAMVSTPQHKAMDRMIPIDRVNKSELSEIEKITVGALGDIRWAVTERGVMSFRNTSKEDQMLVAIAALAQVSRKRAIKRLDQVLGLRIKEEREKFGIDARSPGEIEKKILALRNIAEVLSGETQRPPIWFSGNAHRLETYAEAGEELFTLLLKSKNRAISRLAMELGQELVDADVISEDKANEIFALVDPAEYRRQMEEQEGEVVDVAATDKAPEDDAANEASDDDSDEAVVPEVTEQEDAASAPPSREAAV